MVCLGKLKCLSPTLSSGTSLDGENAGEEGNTFASFNEKLRVILKTYCFGFFFESA